MHRIQSNWLSLSQLECVSVGTEAPCGLTQKTKQANKNERVQRLKPVMDSGIPDITEDKELHNGEHGLTK